MQCYRWRCGDTTTGSNIHFFHNKQPSALHILSLSGSLVHWLKLSSWKIGDRGFVPRSGIQVSKKKMFFPCSLGHIEYCREPPWGIACSASDRQGSNFESCVWRTMSLRSSHHPQEVRLDEFGLNVHKCDLKPHSFHNLSLVYPYLYKMNYQCARLYCDKYFPLLILADYRQNTFSGEDKNRRHKSLTQCWFTVGPAS